MTNFSKQKINNEKPWNWKRTVESSCTKCDLACSQLSTMVQLDKQEMNDKIKNAKHMQWETGAKKNKH